MADVLAVRVNGGYALVVRDRYSTKYCMSKTTNKKEVEDLIERYCNGNWFFTLDPVTGKPGILSKKQFDRWNTWKSAEELKKECIECIN